MKNNKTIFKVGLFVFTALASLWAFGYLSELNEGLESIIEVKELSNYYFLFFLIFGLLLPIYLRLFVVSRSYSKLILDPYLLLMVAQIINEICFVFLLGKGLGVLIGYLFSIIRLIQLKQLFPDCNGSKIMQLFVIFEVIIWTYNIGQISFNRILPFLQS